MEVAPTTADWQETVKGIYATEKLTFAPRLQPETFEKWCSKWTKYTGAQRLELLNTSSV